jgi:ZU5 domain
MITYAIKASQSTHRGTRALLARWLSGAAALAFATACGGNGASESAADGTLQANIGPEGGELVGVQGSALEGLRMSIPAGALSQTTHIEISAASAIKPLPSAAVACGPIFDIQPAGLKLAAPATLTLPFDESKVTDNLRFDDQVKVWALDNDTWGQLLQIDSSQGSVSVETQTLQAAGAGVNPPAETDIVKFDFAPNPKFLNCLARYPGDPTRAPSVHAEVVRGDLNDGLFLYGENIKPNLKFDMFTVENDALLANGTPDPNFKNFGLAWYQSDLEANDRGRMRATIRTILLDQIFGFDPTVTLPPTSTFQVGFWFNDPQDAAPCGFDPTKPTPFNGEHQAGPLAMMSLPDAKTGLGPLCTKPDTSVTPARCDP